METGTAVGAGPGPATGADMSAGKTTTIKAMLGMLPLDSGTVTALGDGPASSDH